MSRVMLMLVLCLFGSVTTKNPFCSTMHFDWQGHRGCRGLLPENTVPAMIKALDLGVNTLEMDVVITKDNTVILSHEPFFNHEITTKAGGVDVTEEEETQLNIYNMTYLQTRSYDVGLKPLLRFPAQQKMHVTKPRLTDVIDSVERYVAQKKLPLPFYNIETKTKPATDFIYHPAPAEFVELLMSIIREKGIANRAIIQSFDYRTLQYLHVQYPQSKTALLVEDSLSLNHHLQTLGFIPNIYSPDYELVTPQLVQECHRLNMKVIPWTVNNVDHMKQLKTLGVDGIITDYPNLKF